MAAARHIPRTELTSKITFTNNVPSPQAVIVGSGAQVEFALAPGSTETIQLVFNPNPSFKNLQCPTSVCQCHSVPGPRRTRKIRPTVASTTM